MGTTIKHTTLAGLALVIGGCAHTVTGPTPRPPTTTSVQTPGPEAAPRAQPPVTPVNDRHPSQDVNDDEDESQYATLRISNEVVAKCPPLSSVKPPSGHEKEEWLYLLKAVADCLNDGPMQGRKIVIRGGHGPEDVVTFVLGRLGVDPDRIVRGAPVAAGSRSPECRLELAPEAAGAPGHVLSREPP